MGNGIVNEQTCKKAKDKDKVALYMKINCYMALHQLLGSKDNGDLRELCKTYTDTNGIDLLPYKFNTVTKADDKNGDWYVFSEFDDLEIEIFDIPQEDKEKVLNVLYPFTPVPSMEDELFDIHEEKYFTVKDFKVVRIHGVVFLVSPYFLHTGGSVLDWINVQKEDEEEEEE